MCYLCEEEGSEQSCQQCSRLICFDTVSADDICAPAYVTSSGDLYCSRCGQQHDLLDEREEELDDYRWEDDMPAIPWEDD